MFYCNSHTLYVKKSEPSTVLMITALELLFSQRIHLMLNYQLLVLHAAMSLRKNQWEDRLKNPTGKPSASQNKRHAAMELLDLAGDSLYESQPTFEHSTEQEDTPDLTEFGLNTLYEPEKK
ncbi:hypothetical protein C8J56DRAFT_902772 [Mycena floridula]|nr:hypothetical protein C8J56DRAFT_902772 [Mycena floridula]